MNVPTIKMTKAEAVAAFREYREAVRSDRPATRKVWKTEDVALMQAYKHLARGATVIDVNVAIKHAGTKMFDGCPIPLPRLAIVASDAPECFLVLNREGGAIYSAAKWTRSERRQTVLPVGTFPVIPQNQYWAHREHKTMTPLIPPALRPKFNLAGYRTFWEVEEWKPEPPKDPMLLKPLGGALYAVLATWDLTEVERSVLRGRLR